MTTKLETMLNEPMTLERTTMTTTNAQLQRPLTLVEKLEQERTRLNKQANDDIDAVSKENHAYQVGLIGGLTNAIDIVKQNSDWVSVDERLPSDWSVVLCYGVPFEWDKTSKPNSNIFCAVYVAEYDRWSVGYSAFGDTSTLKVTHWMSLPKPPSEVQDD